MAEIIKATVSKVKVKQLLNTSSSKSWKQLSADIKNGKDNPLIASSRAGPVIGTFATVVGAIGPFLTAAKVIEVVKPIIGRIIKIIGAFRNPAYVPDLVQDSIVSVQKKILSGVTSLVTRTGDYILNTEIQLKNITMAQLEDLQTEINNSMENMEGLTSSLIDGYSYGVAQTNPALSGVNITINNRMLTLKNDTSAAINAIGETDLAAFRAAALAALNGLIVFSINLDVISPTDEELFVYVDTQIKEMVADLATKTKEVIKGVRINTNSTVSSLDPESAAIYKDLEDGFFNAIVNVMAENKSGVYSAATYKENSDIENIIGYLKTLVEKEIVTVKKRFYDNARKFIETEASIELIKTSISTLVVKTINVYDLFSFKVIKNEINAIAELNSYDADTNYDNPKVDSSYEEAVRIFENYKKETVKDLISGDYVYVDDFGRSVKVPLANMKEFLATGKLVVHNGREIKGLTDEQRAAATSALVDASGFKNIYSVKEVLESDQISITNYSDVSAPIITEVTNYISALVAFDKSVVKAGIKNAIDNYSMAVSVQSYPNPGDEYLNLDKKLEMFKTNMYRAYKNAISAFNGRVPGNLGTLPINRLNGIVEEKVLRYFKQLVKEFLESILALVIDVVINGSVPCKRCLSNDIMTSKLVGGIQRNILNFKSELYNALAKKVDAMVLEGTVEANKQKLLDEIDAEFIADMVALQVRLCGYNSNNKLYQFLLGSEEKKLRDVILDRMRVL